MNEADALDIVQYAIWVVLVASSPAVVVGMAVGVGIALVQALHDAGLPEGVVNLVLGSGRVVGETLVTDPRVKAISFTGSTAVGVDINVKAAALGKKVQAEMGGHNAVVVLAALEA